MELHHIQARADGGVDSFDNCIPLCFDCHANVGHYNPEHPRGRRIRPEELRQHRDQWFRKVASTPAGVAEARDAELDRDVVFRLTTMLPRNENLSFVRQFDYGSTFRKDSHDQLWRFAHEFTGPEHEFIDADLEAFSQALRDVVLRFLRQMAHDTFEEVLGTREIPKDWRVDQRERFDKAQDALNSLAGEVCERYDDLLRLARRKLGVLPAPEQK